MQLGIELNGTNPLTKRYNVCTQWPQRYKCLWNYEFPGEVVVLWFFTGFDESSCFLLYVFVYAFKVQRNFIVRRGFLLSGIYHFDLI